MSDLSSVAGGFIGTVCSSDDLLAAQLHLSLWQFAIAKTMFYVVLVVPALVQWWRSWPRLKAHGFSMHVWRIGLWLLSGFALIEISKVLLQPLIGAPIPCLYDRLATGLVVIMALCALYVFHLWYRSKGSLSKYVLLVVTPVFSMVALNTPGAGEAGAALVVVLKVAVHALTHI